jgi:alanine racemase
MTHDRVASSTCARISLGAFQINLNSVRSYVGPDVRIMAVIKADGYGHGMPQLARSAAEVGVKDFGVARVHEGVELRQGQPSETILVFEIPREDTLDAAIHHNLELTTVTEETAAVLEEAAERAGKKIRVHVKVDTGMGRLGLTPEQANHVVEKVARSRWLELAGVYSHFATSEDPDQSFARLQLRRFHEVLESAHRSRIEIPLRHMANSGAIISLPESHFDLVRPGIMMYGYPPGHGMLERIPLIPVMSLISQVAFVKTVPAGTSISYGRKYFTTETTRIATVPVGYADGYSRLLRGKANALLNGKRHPIVGTICMDQLMIDIGIRSSIRPGAEVVLIGESGSERITAWDIADAIGTIPYEVTCGISRRVERVYVP